MPFVQREGARNSIGNDVGDGLLKTRAEIGDVLLAQRRAHKGLVPERGLEASQREMRLLAAKHRPRQLDDRLAARGHAGARRRL